MDLYKDNWKWYLLSIPLFLGIIAITGKLNILTVILVGGGFLCMSIGSYIMTRKIMQ
ncbi:MAG: hypothetical protein J6E46_09490 [Faecalicoccus sp.]|nr:hypothetical protein [Faecalicoccus sp.]